MRKTILLSGLLMTLLMSFISTHRIVPCDNSEGDETCQLPTED